MSSSCHASRRMKTVMAALTRSAELRYGSTDGRRAALDVLHPGEHPVLRAGAASSSHPHASAHRSRSATRRAPSPPAHELDGPSAIAPERLQVVADHDHRRALRLSSWRRALMARTLRMSCR